MEEAKRASDEVCESLLAQRGVDVMEYDRLREDNKKLKACAGW